MYTEVEPEDEDEKDVEEDVVVAGEEVEEGLDVLEVDEAVAEAREDDVVPLRVVDPDEEEVELIVVVVVGLPLELMPDIIPTPAPVS